MRAIVLEKFGGLDSLVYKDIPQPEPKVGHVVIEIKAFGINHAEIGFSASTRSVRRTASWRPTRPTERWSWSTTDTCALE